MAKSRRRLILEWIGFVCSVLVVAFSIWPAPLVYNRPRLLALIAGCFAAGVTFVDLVKDGRDARRS